jgi:hypothetical protein
MHQNRHPEPTAYSQLPGSFGACLVPVSCGTIAAIDHRGAVAQHTERDFSDGNYGNEIKTASS